MEQSRSELNEPVAESKPAGSPMPSLDAAKYRQFLAPLALEPEHEDRLLASLWSMMEAFVDYGFGWEQANPCQSTEPECTLREVIAAVQIDDTERLTKAFDEANSPSAPLEAPP